MDAESIGLIVVGLGLLIWGLIKGLLGDKDAPQPPPATPKPEKINETINENLDEELQEAEESAPPPSSNAGGVSDRFNNLLDKLRRDRQ